MNTIHKRQQLRADAMLLMVTLCWGVSYYLMSLCLEDLDPFTLNAIRFLGAFGVAVVLSFPRLRHVNGTTLRYSLLVGLALVVVYIGSTFGTKYTALSNAGFLCALTVVFTPLLGFCFLGQRLSLKMKVSVLISLVGIALLTLKEDFSLNMENLKGDLFCILCALFYAIDLLLTERAVSHEEVDAYQLGVFQLGVTGLCNLILAMIWETPHWPTSGSIWGAVIFLSIFCTGVAFVVQPIAQQYTTASHVGVIFTLEPVFAGIVAFFIAKEVLPARSYLGAALMFAGIFIMEMDFGFLQKGAGHAAADGPQGGSEGRRKSKG